MDAPGLTVDDMASVGLSEVDIDSMSDAEADVEQVKAEDDEIDLGNLSKSAEAAPVVKLANVLLVDSLKRGASRHPHRALREGVPGPLPHRRHPLQRDGPAHEAARTR